MNPSQLTLTLGQLAAPTPPTIQSRSGVPSATIVHQFTYGSNTESFEMVGDFESISQAPGGYWSAAGKIEASRVVANPSLYQFGATWRAIVAETGDVVFAGYLLDPVVSQGVATLTARGWGVLPSRNVSRLLYSDMYFGNWSTVKGAPYSDLKNATPYSSTDSSINAQVNGGNLQFSVSNQTDITNGDVNRLAFWGTGQNVTGVSFNWSSNKNLGGGFYDCRVHTTTGPDGANTALTQRTSFDVSGATQSGNYTAWWPSSTDDLVTISLTRSGASGTTSAHYSLWVTDLQVFGIAQAASYSVSDVVGDIANRLRLGTSGIQSSAVGALPLDVLQGAFDSTLDTVSALADWRWVILDQGSGPYMDFGPWNTRVWTLVDPESAVDLTPLERYNRVRVPFNYASGNASNYADVVANPNPFPPDVVSYYPDVSLQAPMPDASMANNLAQVLANYLATVRYAGQCTLIAVADPTGALVTAHKIQPGDTLYMPYYNGLTLRIKEVRRTPQQVELTFDDNVAVVNRLIARANRRMELRGMVGN